MAVRTSAGTASARRTCREPALILDDARAVGMDALCGVIDNGSDVQIAAYAIELHGEVFSNDADFARFEGVRWIDPLDG